jgi:hypothetical protein
MEATTREERSVVMEREEDSKKLSSQFTLMEGEELALTSL